jgi:ketosteroid isomerase-like protein
VKLVAPLIAAALVGVVVGFGGSQGMNRSANLLPTALAGLQRQLSGAAGTAPAAPAASAPAPSTTNPNAVAPSGQSSPRRGTAPRPNAAPGQAPSTNPQAPSADDPAQRAIQQAVQAIDDAQSQAIASQDLSGLSAGATADFAAEQQTVTQDLLDNGVTEIKLVNIEWGPITVNGNTATATAFETWSTTYSDGTSDQSRDRNVYTLVQQDGTWKVQADEHPDSLAGAFPGGLQGIPGIPKDLLPPGLQVPFGNP